MNSFKNSAKMKAVTFSYDDGTTQDIQLIELLNKYGLKATFNINSELLNKSGRLVRGGKSISHYKVWREDLRDIYKDHEVAVHTLTHPNLTQIEDKDEIIRQIEQDRISLSSLVGYEVVGMAYPCGGVNNDDRVADIIKSCTGVKYARTISDNKSTRVQNNLYRFNPTFYHLDFEEMTAFAKEFIESTPTEKQILYIWGHSFEMEYDSANWVKLEEFFKTVSGKEDIFYGTNREVLL